MPLSPKKSIAKLKSYKPNFGKSDSKKVIRLSANENPLGCSRKISKSINKSIFNRYPPQLSDELIASIAKKYNLDENKIILSNGSDELISIIAQSYLNVGDEAIYTQYGFLQFPQAIAVAGGKSVVAKDIKLTVSIDNILKKITKKTRLIFLANPNNPTGTFVEKKEVINLIVNLPSNILLVYDAAYAEYIDNSNYLDGVELVEKNENVIMIRTFSKLHGLAGLRLGWGYCSKKILKILMTVKPPFSVNTIAINSGIIAIRDSRFQKKSFEYNKKNMIWMENQLDKLNICYQKSVANFVLIRFPNSEKHNAKQAENFFLKKGVLVRAMDAYSLNEYIRISLGTIGENKIFVKYLKEFLAR